MNKVITIYFFTLFTVISLLTLSCHSNQLSSPRPNIIYIMADDLGYGELGCYGQQKIETPHIDALAKKGLKFTQFYTGSPVCAPSRCVVLTGQHSGHAYIRGNDEMRARGAVWDYISMINNPGLEGQYPLADSIVTIAEVLQKSGYSTSLFGKWGLGYPGSESTPNQQGFEYFFGFNCQRQAHTLTPVHLWRNEDKLALQNDTIIPRTKLAPGADSMNVSSYDVYFQPDYAPSVIFDDLLAYIDQIEEKPFAIFWESPLPHVPLQAPKKWIDYYVNKWGSESPYTGRRGYFPSRYPRATYAAMISYLDENVGKLVDKLKDKGLYDNTIIVFTSDNGPSYNGGADPQYFDSARPFKFEYGWGKGFLREGGIRMPFIVHWPAQITSPRIVHHISSSQDIFPTLSDLTRSTYENNNIDGLSFASTISGKGRQEEHDHLYWEFPEYGGQIAIRIGDMKGYIGDIHKGNKELHLYNLIDDPMEQNNIAHMHPELVNQMKEIIQNEHITSQNPRWHLPYFENN